MARKPRDEEAGAIHHVFNRGNDKRLIYRDDADRRAYLRLLEGVIVWAGWRCMGYCLMSNHMHFLVETPKPNLGDGMQRLHGRYARRFNDRHGRSGHLFQGRFQNVRVTNDQQFWTTVRYIARNPVEAGLCLRPDEWAWSSHGGVLVERSPEWLDVARLLEYFSGDGGDPSERYRVLIDGDAEEALRTAVIKPQRRGTTPFG
jgi:REP element-mobilizing transposase RayT